MDSKNILIVSAVFPPETVVSAKISDNIATILSESNEVIVLSPRPSRPFGFVFKDRIRKNKNYKHHILDSFVYPKSKILGRMFESFDFGIKAAKFILNYKSNIDLIYMNSWPILSPLLITWVAKYLNIKIIIHTQDIYPESL